MTPLDFLYITLSVSVIVIALAIIIVTIVFIIILWEIRRMVGSIHEAMKDVKKVGKIIRGGIVESMIDYGRRIFQKRSSRKKSQ